MRFTTLVAATFIAVAAAAPVPEPGLGSTVGKFINKLKNLGKGSGEATDAGRAPRVHDTLPGPITDGPTMKKLLEDQVSGKAMPWRNNE